MKVTKPELSAVMQQGRRIALLPENPDGSAPTGRHRLHRRRGPVACYVQITHAALVGPLDETVTLDDARQAGHDSVEAFRDEWVRAHGAAWTGQHAWLVTFTVEPWRETPRLMRGPWDPGVAEGGVTPERRRAPEPEAIDADRVGWQWGRDAGRRHEKARGKTTPPGNRKKAA